MISRVVVARYCSETGRGAGRWLDGWNYELFATDLEAEAYVAPEVVTHPPKLNTADGAARRIGSGRRTTSWDWIGYTATISHLY